MKTSLSINTIINSLSSIPDDFDVQVQCSNRFNPVGMLIVCPGKKDALAFDMSSKSNVKNLLSQIQSRRYISDQYEGTIFINRTCDLWATFPGVITNLKLVEIQVSDKNKVVTFVSSKE